MGRPVKGILMDNGLASSNKCIQFLDRLKINHDPGPAYEPLHKAVQERIFGFIKNEFCAQWPNYIGGGRSEVRHTGKKLSPEETTFTIKEFIQQFDDYMEGFYQTNTRTRTDNYVQCEISIREDFEKRYLSFQKSHIKPIDLRKAYSESVIKRMGYQSLLFGKRGLFNPSLSSPLHPVLCDRNYLVHYLPTDLSEIDIYATEDILIQQTGEYYTKGQLVATLYNQIGKVSAEKQRLTQVLKKKMTKAVKQLTESTVDVAIAKDVHAFAPELNQKGQLIDTRRELVDKVSSVIEDASNKALEVTVPQFEKRGRKPVELDENEFKDEIEAANKVAEDFD